MSEEASGKTFKIWLISAICGVLAFLALMWIAGYSTAASAIVAVLVLFLVAILLWIGWYEEESLAADVAKGHPEADATTAGLMATSSVGDEPVSAAEEIAPEPHAADTREVRSAAAATAPAPEPVTEDAAEETAPAESADGETGEGEIAVGDTDAPAPQAHVADDLKQIKGVGPKIEVQLQDRGITSFAQVAALSPEEITALGADLKGTSAAQLTKWAEQAKTLAEGGETEFSKRVKNGGVY